MPGLAAMMLSDPAIALAGLCIGAAAGYCARRANLCTLGAIESALIGHDWRRMKIFGLALAIALALTQAMIDLAWLDAAATSYAPPRIAIVSILLGSLLFGFGMAMVGTCAFGSLLRLGGGDLRSLVVIVIYAVVATMTLRGAFSGLRIDILESLALRMPGQNASTIPDLIAYFSGPRVTTAIAIALMLALGLPALLDRRLRNARRLMRSAIVLGVAIAAGWLFTGVLPDPLESQMRVQSLTFVAPVARGFSALVFGTREWLDFGVMSVIGVTLGAFIAARKGDDLRIEAFDDHLEMRRHLFGAILMGAGGVLAGGCTIGQGLSAGSVLAVSWPLAVAGLIVGARMGLAVMMAPSWADLAPTWLRPAE